MRRALPCLFLLLALLGGCSREPEIVKRQAYAFGTLIEVSVADAGKADAALAEVLARFDALHRQLHAWQDSELSRLNAALAAGRKFEASPQLAAILQDARRLSQLSDGRFEPAIGRLIALWGFQSDTPATRLPPPDALRALVAARPRMADLRFAGNTVWSVNPAVQLDLGGYAKGYALDQAAHILRRHGVTGALVNIGGNVLALGDAGGRPWRVGIQDPRAAGVLATLELADGEALGTSGDYQRYFEVDGVRYAHLLDPATGQPARGFRSVTVLVAGARAGTRSDALSKPLFIGPPDGLATRAAKLGLTHYMAVDAAGQRSVSPALAARLR